MSEYAKVFPRYFFIINAVLSVSISSFVTTCLGLIAFDKSNWFKILVKNARLSELPDTRSCVQMLVTHLYGQLL